MQYPALVALLSVSLGACAMEPEAEEALSADRADVTAAPMTIPSCATGTWCIEASPTTGTPLLHGVSAVSASDVFAVGDTGTIIRRTGGAWTVMTSGTTNDLRGVWALSSSNVWAVGISGTILRFNGTSWSTVTGVTTSDLDAVWASGANDVWLAGGSSVWHWNGTAFSSTGIGGTLLSVSGTGPSDVWVTGENANVHHWNGTAWSSIVPLAGTSTYFAVLAIGANDVWASDFMPSKQGMHFTGATKWTATNASSGIWDGMSALSSTDVWGAGGDHIGHWNGTAWTTTTPLGTSVSLWSVTTTTGHVWVVGDGAVIAHMPL